MVDHSIIFFLIIDWPLKYPTAPIVFALVNRPKFVAECVNSCISTLLIWFIYYPFKIYIDKIKKTYIYVTTSKNIKNYYLKIVIT